MNIRGMATICALAAVQLYLPARASDAQIVGKLNGAEIVLTASGDRFAGAISSLTYQGMEFIDTADHGREMQSAIQLDGWGECYNPNEAGSYADGDRFGSTSVLEAMSVQSNVLKTRTRPAFWLAPGERRDGACNPALEHPRNLVRTARNPTKVSNFTVSRTVAFYGNAIPGLIDIDVMWRIPEDFLSSNTEALTGYLPGSFDVFMVYDRTSRTLRKVSATAADSPSQHTHLPVIIARKDGAYAMGAFAPQLIKDARRGYMAYFSFAQDRRPTSKWSCVFGEVNIRKGSTYTYSCPIAIGSVDQVIAAIDAYPIEGVTVGRTIPIYRFFNGTHHFMTASFREAAGAGYQFEETGFQAYPFGGKGYRRLLRCYDSIRDIHFVSARVDCEGAKSEGDLGFASVSSAGTNGGKGKVALHRFVNPATGDRLVTVNREEGLRNGLRYERLLGYVDRQ